VSDEPNDGWRDEVFPVTQFQYEDDWPALEDKDISAVKIRMNPVNKGRIWVDGVELKSTLSVKLEAGPDGNLTTVTIEILATVDAGANVYTENLHIKEVALDVDEQD
jgi:hypothetical protein